MFPVVSSLCDILKDPRLKDVILPATADESASSYLLLGAPIISIAVEVHHAQIERFETAPEAHKVAELSTGERLGLVTDATSMDFHLPMLQAVLMNMPLSCLMTDGPLSCLLSHAWYSGFVLKDMDHPSLVEVSHFVISSSARSGLLECI